jgi:two-component system, sensor histidine kinase and response regulator
VSNDCRLFAVDWDDGRLGLISVRVLLAEDNPVNQHLVARILEKRGHEVAVTSDGRQAAEAAAEQRYDVVLMDIEMPVMDGFAATARIREQENGSPRVPVVAMTAHVTERDRERCFAAGMDDYLAKPIRADELLRVVGDIEAAISIARPAAPARQSVFDRAAVMLYFGDDCELIGDAVESFLAAYPRFLANIKDALAGDDARQLERAAHTLKGSVANFHSVATDAAATALEQCGHESRMVEAGAALTALEAAMTDLQPALIMLEKEMRNTLAL